MGYNGRGFFPLWDITKEFFSAVGYNGEGFPLLWDTTEEDFFRCGIQQRKISEWRTIFFLLYPTTQEIILPLYLHHNRFLCSVLYPRKIFCIVSHNAAGFLPLYPTMEDILLHCGIQRKRFFFLWDTSEEAFLHCGKQRKRFFPFWDTTEEVFFRYGIQWK